MLWTGKEKGQTGSMQPSVFLLKCQHFIPFLVYLLLTRMLKPIRIEVRQKQEIIHQTRKMPTKKRRLIFNQLAKESDDEWNALSWQPKAFPFFWGGQLNLVCESCRNYITIKEISKPIFHSKHSKKIVQNLKTMDCFRNAAVNNQTLEKFWPQV